MYCFFFNFWHDSLSLWWSEGCWLSGMPSHPHWAGDTSHFNPFTHQKSRVAQREWRSQGQPLLIMEDLFAWLYVDGGHSGYLNSWKPFVSYGPTQPPLGEVYCPFWRTGPLHSDQNHLHLQRLILAALGYRSMPTELTFPFPETNMLMLLIVYNIFHQKCYNC